jgi:hypothetical protein
MRLLWTCLLVLAGVSAASADIRINESRYEGGKTIVVGQTEPNSVVTLDNKYKTKSDADGNFRFAVAYKSFTCMSNIRAGDSDYSAVLAGCLDPGFGDDDRMPVNKTVVKRVTEPPSPK